ncbi:hypothetical protein BKA66DRAFT_415912 [Pyrenochaeta sp. MPI-SDFR-AT-0127]|nr:hypothetical protein BKA66DRAFT_415912 [Pyrenochaeta sp. MPI-SDFR-AT-0127]
MAVLTDLPPELLEHIFHFLSSIDDVIHFGQTCQKVTNAIQRQSIYIDIMRSVIKQSPQHRYDHQLCKILILHKRIVRYFEQNGGQRPLPVTQVTTVGSALNTWEEALVLSTKPVVCSLRSCSNCLPDEVVNEILARYQGLRVLEELWLQRQLKDSDFLSMDDSADANQLMHSFRVLVDREEEFQDGNLSAPNIKTPEFKSYTKFNSDQRARFYSAVVCVWLLNEIRWVLTNFAFPARFDLQVLLLENCKVDISKQMNTPLLDQLDQYTVHAFMYHHLLPLYGSFLADRNSSKLPLTFYSDFIKDSTHCTRLLQTFLTAGQTYIQPPDLIDLIVRSKISRKPPYSLMTLPATTEEWVHPNNAFAFPPNLDLCNDSSTTLLQRTSLTHLSLINRSSFHQTRFNMSQNVIIAPAPGQPLYTLQDHAGKYFADRVMVAFELHECQSNQLRDIRDVFPKRWGSIMWAVWWWANSEEKARAKLELWRHLSQ